MNTERYGIVMGLSVVILLLIAPRGAAAQIYLGECEKHENENEVIGWAFFDDDLDFHVCWETETVTETRCDDAQVYVYRSKPASGLPRHAQPPRFDQPHLSFTTSVHDRTVS